MFSNFLAVGAGGAIGAMGRYAVGLIPALQRGAFPLHTLLINLGGAILIGCITFILSAVGLKVGNVFGLKYKNKAEMVGGAILILMGLKILLEHLGVIQF